MKCWMNRCLLSIAILCSQFVWFSVSAHGHDESLDLQAVELLQAKCISCHGAEEAEGKLRLDSHAAALRGGEHGPAISLEKPTDSLLLKYVTGSAGEELRMPPKNPLSQAEIQLLQRWLQQGSKWNALPREAMQPASSAEAIGMHGLTLETRSSRSFVVNVWTCGP